MGRTVAIGIQSFEDVRKSNYFYAIFQGFSIKDTRRALIDLFKVLDTKLEDRDKYLDECEQSYLPQELKEKVRELIGERIDILS